MSQTRKGAVFLAILGFFALAFGGYGWWQGAVPDGATVVQGSVVDLVAQAHTGRPGTDYWPVVEFRDPISNQSRTTISRNDWLRNDDDIATARVEGRSVAVSPDGTVKVVRERGVQPYLLSALGVGLLGTALVIAVRD